jgi:hypothetical protein
MNLTLAGDFFAARGRARHAPATPLNR